MHAVPPRTYYKIRISSTRPGPCCEASIRTKSYVSCSPKVGYRTHNSSLLALTSKHYFFVAGLCRGGSCFVLHRNHNTAWIRTPFKQINALFSAVSAVNKSECQNGTCTYGECAVPLSLLCRGQYMSWRHREIGCNNLILPNWFPFPPPPTSHRSINVIYSWCIILPFSLTEI